MLRQLPKFAFPEMFIIRRTVHSATETQCSASIPSPQNLPLLGHLHLFTPLGPYKLTRLYDAYTDLYHTYGPVVSLDLGTKMIALFSPEDISTLFRHEGKYPMRPSFEALKFYRKNQPDKYSSGGIVTENGKEWHRLRQACHWMLRPNAAHPYLPAQERVADDFVKLVTNSRNHADEINDFLSYLYRYTEESIGLVCFGTRMGLLDSNPTEMQTKIVEAVNDTLDAMTSTLLGFPWWKMFKTKTYLKLENSQNFMYSVTQRFISEAEERRKSSGEDATSRFDFLRRLGNESQLSQKDVALVIMEIFFAGIDAVRDVNYRDQEKNMST